VDALLFNRDGRIGATATQKSPRRNSTRLAEVKLQLHLLHKKLSVCWNLTLNHTLEFESDTQTTSPLSKEILLPILQRYRVCRFPIPAD
jgi:hypothetical protein